MNWAKNLLNPIMPSRSEFCRIRYQMPPRAQIILKSVPYAKVLHEMQRHIKITDLVIRASTIGRSIGEFYVKKEHETKAIDLMTKAGLTILDKHWDAMAVPTHVEPGKEKQFLEFSTTKAVERLARLIKSHKSKAFKACALEGYNDSIVDRVEDELLDAWNRPLDNLFEGMPVNRGEIPPNTHA